MKDSSQNIKMIGVFGLLGFATSALMLSPAYAQDTPALPSNLPPAGSSVAGLPSGVSQVAAPPAGLNPLTASAAAKARYAVPPAPDAKAAPEAYKKWQQAVSAMANPKNRVPTTLTQTNIFNGPAKIVGNPIPSGAAGNAVTSAVRPDKLSRHHSGIN